MDFYRAFEEKHRGPREIIRARLEVYLPFVTPLKDIYPEPQALDLGCGRGEWLELMGKHGFRAEGVDLDEGMLEPCIALKLNVHKGCALSFLKNLPNESQAVVTGFHVAEHIPFDDLRTIFAESIRVLKPGGILILETPNPENIIVASENFYLDPTHQKPLPSLLLSFVSEYYGFKRTKVVRLQDVKGILQKDFTTINDILHGVSPDYAIVAQKHASSKTLSHFNAAFDTEYGVSLGNLTTQYEEQTEASHAQISILSSEMSELKSQIPLIAAELADVKSQLEASHAQISVLSSEMSELKSQIPLIAAELADVKSQLNEFRRSHQKWETLCSEYEHELQKVKQSTSWKVTAPLRAVKDRTLELQDIVARRKS